jgi:hypothetical protein
VSVAASGPWSIEERARFIADEPPPTGDGEASLLDELRSIDDEGRFIADETAIDRGWRIPPRR